MTLVKPWFLDTREIILDPPPGRGGGHPGRGGGRGRGGGWTGRGGGGGWGPGGSGGGGGGGGSLAIIQANEPAATGNQTYTVSGFGTPIGGLIFGAAAQIDTQEVIASGCEGAFDGTTQWYASNFKSPTGPSSTSKRRSNTGECLNIETSSNSTRASFVEFVEDGVTLNFSSVGVPGSFILILFTGDALSFETGTESFATENNVTSVSTSFEPGLVFMSAGWGGFNGTQFNSCVQAIGFATWDGSTLTQISRRWVNHNGSGAGKNFSRINTSAIITEHDASYTAELENVSASGFDVRSLGADLSSNEFGYAVIKSTEGSFSVSAEATPTTTGVDSITPTGFTPDLGIVLTSIMPSADTTYGDTTEASAVGLGVFTDSSNEYSNTWRDENGNTNHSVHTLAASRALTQLNAPEAGGGGADPFIRADFSAWRADGVDLNYLATDVTSRAFIAMFMKV